ncbi:malto-oligosyltrehalose trehalohydrolase [Azospirillum sp.]|uniref:malto-oligosyltrehalose trehalohydrolase n=1 Tax=Azospirillum sp. TaxID=34012 RepID=UPI002D33A8CB|nr:malto-oligosyltrehalose trehalohydrolase [Azospirillum sp.]HYD65304.1 malto-oligosyltrehalose trehalohydrolase [Azospirillum sp.]
MTANAHAMPFGAEVRPDGSVRFRLWAPTVPAVQVEIEGAENLPMAATGAGWFECATDRARPGSRYRFVLPDGLKVPDPASRFQPDDVNGPSQVVDPGAYRWQATGWRGRPWHEAVLYELHVGTFTAEGTYRAAIAKLDHLKDLGVTAVELMPLSDFAGTRNWGYDGVLPFAPDGAYGTPEELKALVDAAHARGLMMFLDVVYNHFGPEGNYLHAYAAPFFTDRHHTPWGAAINVDGQGSATVRDFFIHNALYWLEEYRFDGLRFDAVHAIIDDSDRRFLNELAERVQGTIGRERPIHLVLENDDNAARLLEPGADRFTAQWNDDYHHVAHVLATGESGGYYADYAGDPVGAMARALAEGFVYQGDPSPYRDGERRGSPSAHLPPLAFVNFLQNHDQIGNRALGERLAVLAEPRRLRALATVTLLAPPVPMLFQGEEWGERRPFNFFCDFQGDLADAVREGRRREFAKFPEFVDPQARARIPDPNAPATFEGSKLDWDAPTRDPHAGWLSFTRALLRTRAAEVMPRLAGVRGGGSVAWRRGAAFAMAWTLGDGGALTLLANLGDAAVEGVECPAGRLLAASEEGAGDDVAHGRIAGWTALWFLEDAQ